MIRIGAYVLKKYINFPSLFPFIYSFFLFIVRIYHKTQQVYTEKEIVALIAKAGIATGSIADVHQSLIDDGLVDKEKIGGSNYFWSFKAKAERKAQKQHKATLQRIEDLKPKLEEASAKLADAKRGREELGEGEEGETRAQKLARLSELNKKKGTIEKELESLKENDPAALADLEKELKLVTEAANRWTDNIFECKTYLVKKRGMEKKEAMKIIGITANFDCKCWNAYSSLVILFCYHVFFLEKTRQKIMLTRCG